MYKLVENLMKDPEYHIQHVETSVASHGKHFENQV